MSVSAPVSVPARLAAMVGAVALAVAAADASAAPGAPAPAPAPATATTSSTPIGGSNGVYAFSGANDQVFTISLLQPGTYDFSSLVQVQPGSDSNYNLAHSSTYLQLGDQSPLLFAWSGKTGSDTGEFTIDAPTTLAIHVDSNWAANTHGHNGIAGTFGGNFTIASFTPPATAPVPEPASAAMLVAGIGLLGFLGRRRRRD